MADALPGPRSSNKLRLVAVVALAALGLFEVILGVLDLPGARGHFGWYLGQSDSTVIRHLAPGQAAERAGVEVGDRIDLQRLYPRRMIDLDPIISYERMPGTRVEIPLIRGTKHLSAIVTMGSAMAEPPLTIAASIVAYAIVAVALLFGAWLVIVRPTLMRWAFYAFLLSGQGVQADSLVLSRFGTGGFLETRSSARCLGPQWSLSSSLRRGCPMTRRSGGVARSSTYR